VCDIRRVGIVHPTYLHACKLSTLIHPKMQELIPLNESEQLAPEQWVKLYGVAHGQCSYIVTCQVWQVMEIFGSKRKKWHEDFFVTPIEKIANRSLV
jgi:hypothetical protein